MTQVMNQHQQMHHKATHRLDMGDAAEAPHPTLPRAETHATKISVEISIAEVATNSTASPSLPTIVMTADELS